MKSLMKKSLLAMSVAVACSATAGTVSVTKQVHSVEGLAGVTANQTSNSISYTVAAAYAVGDKITFTFPDGALVATTFPSQINVAAVDSATASSAIAGMGLGLLNSTTSSVTYRVTSLSQPDDTPGAGGTAYTDRTTLGAVVTLGAIGYKPASVVSAPVTVTVSSQTQNGDVLDNSGTLTATVAESKTQFGSIEITDTFGQTIDVSSMRKAFVGGGVADLKYTVTNPVTTGWLNLATVNATSGSNFTLYGEAGKMGSLKSTNFKAGGTVTFTEDAAKVAVAYNGMVTNDTVTFTPSTGDKAVVLETQDFTADFVYNYTSAGAATGSATIGTGKKAGSWTLNGATVNIPYMPYGPNSSQIIYVSNSGTQTGDVTVTAFDDKGTAYDLGVVGTAAGSKVTKLTADINAKLMDRGFNGTKASLTVTVNAPEADITVYASYNVGGADRGFVNTDQYKGKK
jgi:hypothetical protein